MKPSIIFCGMILLVGLMTATNCKNTNQATNSTKVDQHKIVTQLKGRVKPEFVVSGYQKYDVKLLEPLDKATNTWLFSYDPKLIAPEEMLEVMRNSQYVSTAKFYRIE